MEGVGDNIKRRETAKLEVPGAGVVLDGTVVLG
jgi:hypothetical protein